MTRTECQELVDAAILEFVEEVEKRAHLVLSQTGRDECNYQEAIKELLSEMGLEKEKTK